MRTRQTILNIVGAGATGTLALALIISRAASQSTTGQAATTPSPAAKKKPDTATPEMIQQAIERSQARAAKQAPAAGSTEKWGIEEPFTYKSGKTAD